MSYDEPKPLHSIEAEMAMLGSMILSDKAATQCLMLVDESDLYRPAHRLMFRAMGSLKAKGFEIDPNTLIPELQSTGDLANVGGADYVTEVELYVGGSGGSGHCAETILELSRLRKLEQMGRDLIGKVYSFDDGNAAEIASWAALAALGVGGSAAGVKSMDEIDENGGDDGLSTGIREIDSVMETGGAPLGQMCVIVAEEKHGKSTELCGIAIHSAWEGRGNLYVTLADLNDKRLKRKFLRGRCGFSEISTAKEFGREKEFKDAKYELEKMVSIKVLDRTKLGGDDVDDVLAGIETYRQRRARSDKPLIEVEIDYAQKLTSRKCRSTNAVEVAAYCSKRISAYAEQTGLVIWIASQYTAGNLKMGTRAMTKGGRCWLEDCGMALLIEKLDEEDRKKYYCDARMTLTHSRFKGAGTVVDLSFDKRLDLLVPL